jgi:cytochrome c-type biogenesis protein CcmH
MKRLSAASVLLLWCACSALWAQETGLSEDEKVARITGNLVCQCGCANKMVRSCACPTAIIVTQEVRKLIAEGTSEEKIFAFYEEKYGHQVFGAPKAEGFNIVGWILPFVFAGLGTLVVVVVAKRLKPTQKESTETDRKSAGIDEKYRKLLDQELKDW